jgi:hypothetical protein
MFGNGLDGTLPAELGKLTDLESLCVALRRRRVASPSAGPVGAALTRLRWCAVNASRTSSAARSAAGSARWRSSPSCKRPSPPLDVGARTAGVCAGASMVLPGTRSRNGMLRAVLWGVAPGTAVGEDAREDRRRRLGGRQGYSSTLGGHAACDACSPIYLYVPLLGGSMMRTTGCCGTMWSSLGYQ